MSNINIGILNPDGLKEDPMFVITQAETVSHQISSDDFLKTQTKLFQTAQ